MINWRNGEVRLAKGARSPRPSPNHDQREENDAKRSLLRVMGERTDQVTHQEPCRRKGSRPRIGGTNGKASRRKSKRATDWSPDSEDPLQREGSPESSSVVNLQEYRQRKVDAESSSEEQQETHPPKEEKPYMWTDADFTPEALAAYDAKLKASREDVDEERQRRQEMEAVFDSAKRKKRAMFRAATTPRSVVAPEEDQESCVHHMDLSEHPQAPPKAPRIEKRPMIGSSHGGVSRSRKPKPQP